MKKIISTSPTMKRLVWVVLCVTLFSFSNFGGESYTIYLNDKLIAQEYVVRKSALPSVALDQNASNDQLLVYYSHCGRIGKGRTLTIKDDQQKILKEWNFANVTDEHTPMIIKTKDVFALVPAGSNRLNLVYSSTLLPDGKLLANLVLGRGTSAVGH